jgi:hypothetical protein
LVKGLARLSRIVIPNVAHHVTQRGNRREALFTQPGDFALSGPDGGAMPVRCVKNVSHDTVLCLR